RTDVIQALNSIKEKASQTHEKPAQIIQDTIINIPKASFSYMPNNNALRKQILRIRNKDLPSQPQSLEDIDMPDLLCSSIRGKQFLAREIDYNNEKLMIFCEEAGYSLNSPIIITDFEQSAINASHLIFPNSRNKCCFFHFCQNVWRQIQAAGLSTEYGNDEEFSIKLCLLTALAFLLPSEIPGAFDQIKLLIPPNASQVIEYFEKTYNVEELDNILEMEIQFNFVEGWYYRWNNIIGKPHIGVYTIIEEMRKEQHQTDLQIEKVLRGKPHLSQPRRIINSERRIIVVFNSRNNYSIIDYLKGIAHNISL
ncbi:7315_t:CDS:2, partial [Dentiscutata erythropus]